MKNRLKIKRYLDQFDSIENQTFIITGANSGLGYSTTKHLASLGAHVVMACRNLDKAELAKNEIKKLYPNAKLSIIHYDQADFKSIDVFVEEVFKSHADYKSIILNAGIYHPKKGLLTKDGYPLTMGTNYIGVYYLLTKLKDKGLLDDKKERSIVFIGSLSWHAIKRSDIKTIMTSSKGSQIAVYSRSKTLLGSLAYQLSRHKENDILWVSQNIKVLLMHPGITSTNIVGSIHSSYPSWFSKLAQKALNLFVHHPDKASLGIIKLAIDKHVDENKIMVPRGLFQISGYPKTKKYPSNLKKMNQTLIDISKDVINHK